MKKEQQAHCKSTVPSTENQLLRFHILIELSRAFSLLNDTTLQWARQLRRDPPSHRPRLYRPCWLNIRRPRALPPTTIFSRSKLLTICTTNTFGRKSDSTRTRPQPEPPFPGLSSLVFRLKDSTCIPTNRLNCFRSRKMKGRVECQSYREKESGCCQAI